MHTQIKHIEFLFILLQAFLFEGKQNIIQIDGPNLLSSLQKLLAS